MQDCISVKDLKVFAYHGVLPEEKRQGQYFYLDIALYGDFLIPCLTDRVEDTVNYDEVCNCACRAMTENTFDLIERAAQVVCDSILRQFEKVSEVEVTLKKPHAPVKCDIAYAAVTIRRAREVLR
ncbi:MAG: dihydroneopterin aldolase [Clostridia bacterium]|nr:dihydroneopterin aldolase [Clostridia bacterium]